MTAEQRAALVAKRDELDQRREVLKGYLAEAGETYDISKITGLKGSDAEKATAIKSLSTEVEALESQVAFMIEQFGSETVKSAIHPGGTGAGTVERKLISAKGPSPWAGKLPMKELLTKAIDPSGAVQLGTVFRQEPVAFGYRTLLDVIPVQPMKGTDVFEYLKQTVRTNNAAPVARGGTKPTSVVSLVKVVDTARYIATISEPIANDYLADVAALGNFLAGELVFMVREKLETQILAGDGTLPNLSGILDQSGLQTQAKGADPTPDAIHKAITKVRTGDAKVEPSHVALHPSDWEDIRLLKTADGEYIFGHPGETAPQSIFGVPVVLTLGLTAGTGIVGDFTGSAMIHERENVKVDWNEGDPLLFNTNQKRFRAEGRWGLAVFRPAAFCSVTGI